MKNAKELLVGVIGTGGRGDHADHAHKPGEGVRIVAGADTDEAALAKFRAKYPDALATRDYRELLANKEIDAVFVMTPDYLHEEHATAALEAGKHVYLEKPMAITIAGCDRILKAAFERKLKIYLGHNMRHCAFLRVMKKLIDDGAIGEVRTGWCRHFISYGGDACFKNYLADRSKSTSLLLQKGAHDIDVLHWLCGGYTRRTTAMGNLRVYNRIQDRHPPGERGDSSWHNDHWPPLSQKGMNPVIDVEDLSMMLMELDNGVLCSYQQCHYSPDGWRNYCIIGTAGRIENFNDYHGDSQVQLWNKRCYYNAEGDATYPIAWSDGGHGGADPLIVAEFVRYVRAGGRIATSPLAARNSVAAGCMATHSLRNGSVPMDIPPVPDAWREYFEKDLE